MLKLTHPSKADNSYGYCSVSNQSALELAHLPQALMPSSTLEKLNLDVHAQHDSPPKARLDSLQQEILSALHNA
jgi:hypothetical protein